MNTHIKVLIGSMFLVVCTACNSTDSPDELMTRLSKNKYVRVEKGHSITASPPVEIGMSLKLDDVEAYKATRYPSNKMASDFCQTKESGKCFTIDRWAIFTDSTEVLFIARLLLLR